MKYEILEIGEHKMAVRFGFNALRKYSLMTGATMNDLNKLASGELTFNDAFSLIYCGIEDGYRASKQPFKKGRLYPSETSRLPVSFIVWMFCWISPTRFFEI